MVRANHGVGLGASDKATGLHISYVPFEKTERCTNTWLVQQNTWTWSIRKVELMDMNKSVEICELELKEEQQNLHSLTKPKKWRAVPHLLK